MSRKKRILAIFAVVLLFLGDYLYWTVPVSFGKAVAKAVTGGEANCGILVCGTGVGISIAANKTWGIRAVVCSEPYSAMLSKQHNNTNVLAMGARVIGIELAKMIVDAWLGAEFEGGRHLDRVNMLE